MGPAQLQRFVDAFLEATEVATIWVDTNGRIGADQAVRPPLGGRDAFCCPRGSQFVLAYRLDLWMQEQRAAPAQPVLVDKLAELADAGGVGLTPYAIAIERAEAVVREIAGKFEAMKQRGELQALNRSFKERRASEPSLRYGEFLEQHQRAAIVAAARGRV